MKLYRILLLLLAASVMAVSCDDDDEEAPDTTGNNNDVTITQTTVQYSTGGSLRDVVRFTYKDNGGGIGSRTLAATSGSTPAEHVMDGFVFVNDGQTLTIEAGAVVKGEAGQGASASGLLVARGGTINASGTSSNPIIFTYDGDDVQENDEPADVVTGQWSGVAILGAAPINVPNQIVEGLPTTEPRGEYGGTSGTDNSGTFTYCSIRNTGTVLASNSELQGLTLGGVGSGTTIDFVESIFSEDDGIEIFGGTVDVLHFLVAFVDDDMFDLDQGWQGKGQFWFGFQFDDNGNRGGEWDGDDAPNLLNTDGQPWSTAQIANMTLIGQRNGGDGGDVLRMRNNAGYSLFNSILEYGNVGLELQGATNATVPTWYDHFDAGRASIRSNVIANVGSGPSSSLTDGVSVDVNDGGGTRDTEILDSLAAWNNVVRTGSTMSYPNTNRTDGDGSVVNPNPNTTGFPTAYTLPSGFTSTNYIGAFNGTFSTSWANWTYFEDVYGN